MSSSYSGYLPLKLGQTHVEFSCYIYVAIIACLLMLFERTGFITGIKKNVHKVEIRKKKCYLLIQYSSKAFFSMNRIKLNIGKYLFPFIFSFDYFLVEKFMHPGTKHLNYSWLFHQVRL